MLLDALEHVGGLEDEPTRDRRRRASASTSPRRAGSRPSAALARAASRRRSSSSLGRSGSSRRRPCPCAASCHLRDDLARASARSSSWAIAWANGLRQLVGRLRCSAARRPAGPSSPRSSGSTRGRSRRTARAAAAPTRQQSTIVGRRAGVEVEGEHRRPLDAPRPATARGAARAPRAAPSRPASAGPSQTQKSMSPASGPASTGAVFTQSGRCLGQRFSKKRLVSSTPFGEAPQRQRPAAEVGERSPARPARSSRSPRPW